MVMIERRNSICYNDDMEKKSLKVCQLTRVAKDKIGRISTNGIKLEPHEYSTMILLAEYGFDVECAKKTDTPKTNNADVIIMGTVWEMKAPETVNRATLKKRMHKASKQADKTIFDLRNIRRGRDEAEKTIMELFIGNRILRRMILIRSDREVIDIMK